MSAGGGCVRLELALRTGVTAGAASTRGIDGMPAEGGGMVDAACSSCTVERFRFAMLSCVAETIVRACTWHQFELVRGQRDQVWKQDLYRRVTIERLPVCITHLLYIRCRRGDLFHRTTVRSSAATSSLVSKSLSVHKIHVAITSRVL